MLTESSRVNAAASDLTRFRKGAFSQGRRDDKGTETLRAKCRAAWMPRISTSRAPSPSMIDVFTQTHRYTMDFSKGPGQEAVYSALTFDPFTYPEDKRNSSNGGGVNATTVRRSAAAILNTFTRFRIILTNAVKYVTNVESYDRRIQSAINIQGRKMQRRAQFLLTRALRKAGWK